MSFFKKILPKKDTFYQIISEVAENIQIASKILHEMFSNPDILPENTSKIHIIENKCDELTHNIIHELNESFITPIDREDIYELANALDDIIDAIDTIAWRLSTYKLKKPTVFGPQLSEILMSQTKLILEIINSLHDSTDSSQKIFTIRNLETAADGVFHESIKQLFEKQTDAIELIKEKEILENIEKTVDRCQRAATVMEGILIKNV
ncbi:MAG: DUF47 family protein [Ignavibacteria bacterium]|nr:DUF47 family protein [Ignavibacteria bacterium]